MKDYNVVITIFNKNKHWIRNRFNFCVDDLDDLKKQLKEFTHQDLTEINTYKYKSYKRELEYIFDIKEI